MLSNFSLEFPLLLELVEWPADRGAPRASAAVLRAVRNFSPEPLCRLSIFFSIL